MPSASSYDLRKQGRGFEIAVCDNGPGIDSAHIEHITDAFYRPDTSRTRDTGGMGLGLHLCQRIAQAHAGSLSVKNTHLPAKNADKNDSRFCVVASINTADTHTTDTIVREPYPMSETFQA